MLQEIAPHILHNEFKNPPPSPRDTDLVAVFDGGSALLAQEGGFPTVAAVRALGAVDGELIYLFAVDEIGFFLLERPSKTVKAALQPAPTTAFRTMEPRFMRLAAPTALHLMNWYRTNRFCGCCGAPTVREDKERAMRGRSEKEHSRPLRRSLDAYRQRHPVRPLWDRLCRAQYFRRPEPGTCSPGDNSL